MEKTATFDVQFTTDGGAVITLTIPGLEGPGTIKFTREQVEGIRLALRIFST